MGRSAPAPGSRRTSVRSTNHFYFALISALTQAGARVSLAGVNEDLEMSESLLQDTLDARTELAAAMKSLDSAIGRYKLKSPSTLANVNGALAACQAAAGRWHESLDDANAKFDQLSLVARALELGDADAPAIDDRELTSDFLEARSLPPVDRELLAGTMHRAVDAGRIDAQMLRAGLTRAQKALRVVRLKAQLEIARQRREHHQDQIKRLIAAGEVALQSAADEAGFTLRKFHSEALISDAGMNTAIENLQHSLNAGDIALKVQLELQRRSAPLELAVKNDNIEITRLEAELAAASRQPGAVEEVEA
jgi:hypothetical protein